MEQLEHRRLLTSMPYGATELDLGEFFLGDVAVTPVLLESTGQQDADTEDWNELTIQLVLDNVNEGLQWWVDTLETLTPFHELSFTVDTTHALEPFETRYEPISRRSNDYVLYVQEFLNAQGHNSGNLELDIRAFNQAQRVKHDTHWSFTIFIVPSFNDSDGQFAPGGSFRNAFAFAGGLFIVSPATRPASTYAHEIGHIFWGRDEYIGGGNYFNRRGYYNTQNLNAYDNPEPGFEQQPSIMASGSLLDIAYMSNTSPESTLAMIGWQDSDQDGIFDVLDVPHKLTGTGYLDVDNSVYRFVGQASVQTLPNLNPAGLRNDITINRIREIEYRFDGGDWQIYSLPDAYEVNLDLSIDVPDGAELIEIRARDSATTVTSNLFQGRLFRADATPVAGINGFVWLDDNQNGLRDVGEYGPELWSVELVDAGGSTLALRTEIEPDDFPDGQLASGFSSQLTLSTNGTDGDGRVAVFADTLTSTGNKSFRGYSKSTRSYLSNWNSSSRRLQADFASPTSVVMIDAIGSSNDTYGRLEAFNSSGQLVGRYTTAKLGLGEVETMLIERGASDIAYIIAGGHSNTSVKLDRLRFGPETSTVTDALGYFAFPSLPQGDYNVRVTPTGGFAATSPAGGQQAIFVSANTAVTDVDFGFAPTDSPWQNPNNSFDVNADEIVSPLDALLIVNDINLNDSRDLTGSALPRPPYLDVSGDSFVSALDVLLVVNHLNANGGNGEGEFSSPPLEGTKLSEQTCSFAAEHSASVEMSAFDVSPNSPQPEKFGSWGTLATSLQRPSILDADEEESEWLEALLAAHLPAKSL